MIPALCGYTNLATVSTPFLPTDIANCVFWVDASDAATVHLVSGKIDTWDDKSTVGNHLFATAPTARPTYVTAAQNGLNVADFDGVENMLVVPYAAPWYLRNVSAWTLAILCKPDVTNVAQCGIFVSISGLTGRAALIPVYLPYVRMYGRRNDGDTAGIADSTTTASTSAYASFIATASYTNTRATLYHNGSQIAQNTSWLTSGSTPNTGGWLEIGGRGDEGGRDLPFNGRICECVVYEAELSAADVTALHSGWQTKWAF